MLKEHAIRSGADAFVTADIRYHDFFSEKKNFLMVDAGHFESEFPVVEAIRKEISEAFEQLTVNAAETLTNPVRTYIAEYKNRNH